MKTSEFAYPVLFDQPARYLIRVQGRIKYRASDYLEGMEIEEQENSSGLPMTTLSGKLMDQAALVGVLVALYEMHLPVLSVEYLDFGQNWYN